MSDAERDTYVRYADLEGGPGPQADFVVAEMIQIDKDTVTRSSSRLLHMG